MSLKTRLLLSVLKRLPLPKRIPSPQKRILVVATTALGDTLWSTASLASLRHSFPDGHISVLTSKIGEEVLRHNPWTDKIFVLEEPLSRYFFSLWRQLRREKYDTVLLLHASQRLALPLCKLLGASTLVGTSGINKGLDALFTHTLPNDYQHEIVRRLKIVEHIGGKAAKETLSIFLKPEEETMRLPPGRWIALHPGSKDVFKRWPAEYFIRVGIALKKKHQCEILVTGSREEKPLMEKIAAQIPGARLSPHEIPLRQFASLLKQVDLLISNDTGPVHLACALDIPVIAIHSSTDPSLCGPHKAEKAAFLYKPRTCEPCIKRKCRRPFCLLQITPEEVEQAAAGLLPL